jgi:hypothetical protein
MGTAKKSVSVIARLLGLSTVLVAGTALAGPLGNLAGNLHRATGAVHAATVSLASLHPRVELAARPQLSLDAPRPNTLNLHEAPARLAAAETSEAIPHSPRGLHWEDASAPVNPHLITLARNYHHDGLPVVKLWQADRNMVSIGLNPHGVPGIFFTQTLGK